MHINPLTNHNSSNRSDEGESMPSRDAHGSPRYQKALFIQLIYSFRIREFVDFELSKGIEKWVFLTNESANKAEINILSARDTTRPGP